MKQTMSQLAFERAQKILPGGVNSPVRAFGSVGGTPPFIARAHGAHLWDVDGNEYIDYVGSWGPMIVGHAHPEVTAAVIAAAKLGTSYGAPTEQETLLAEAIQAALPSIEMLRLVNSGTEAVMSAVRLARGATGRAQIIKFAGCYHGHADCLLIHPTSAGITAATAQDTIVCHYNDAHQVETIMDERGKEIAAIIVEPVAGNMGVVLPGPQFLTTLRALADRAGALLIFDEVMTGFRVASNGAQGFYRVRPDLTCLGKIIGGGLPVGAYGGRKNLMQHVAPLGSVYQAGTLSGNPLATAAGLQTLEILARPGTYAQLERTTNRLVTGVKEILSAQQIPHQLHHIGSMWSLFFGDQPVTDYATAAQADRDRFRRFFHTLLANGVHLAPSPFEAGFVSLAHGDEDIQKTIAAVERWTQHERKKA